MNGAAAAAADLSVVESSLSLDESDDHQTAEVDLEVLVGVLADWLCRTPRPASHVLTNPAAAHVHAHTPIITGNLGSRIDMQNRAAWQHTSCDHDLDL